MQVHRYKIMVYEGAVAHNHGMGRMQERIYIPNQGVIGFGFHNQNSIDFFNESAETIEEAEKCIRGKLKEAEYIGKIELPDGIVEKVVSAGKALRHAEEEFKKSTASLISLL